MMTTRTPIHASHQAPPSTRLGRWAVGLGAGAALACSGAAALFGVAYGLGGEEAISDNWVGLLVTVVLFGSVAASLTAFVLALAARLRHEEFGLMWVPLSVFPALVAFLVLGEAFWWE